jgi:uncharacterized protein involved in exopolysaccharide biosynthesis
MILEIIIIVAVLIAAVLAFAATKPKTFHGQRSISIKAPPEKILTRSSTTSTVGVAGRPRTNWTPL